ncbi:hypothetical protein GMRT_14395 [Giardia muris]|uniref:Uncharacterized protein n=1 Tax=Giardia muris TaxID=5742 RepID=A0A4Z1T2R8_GIAMU|nr:hypothetical protein GMRT_14395 [Giardia muris]|eukprot:TNJ28243.1 hypothetical protein GMRT_14395 [Giardia muris]
MLAESTDAPTMPPAMQSSMRYFIKMFFHVDNPLSSEAWTLGCAGRAGRARTQGSIGDLVAQLLLLDDEQLRQLAVMLIGTSRIHAAKAAQLLQDAQRLLLWRAETRVEPSTDVPRPPRKRRLMDDSALAEPALAHLRDSTAMPPIRASITLYGTGEVHHTGAGDILSSTLAGTLLHEHGAGEDGPNPFHDDGLAALLEEDDRLDPSLMLSAGNVDNDPDLALRAASSALVDDGRTSIQRGSIPLALASTFGESHAFDIEKLVPSTVLGASSVSEMPMDAIHNIIDVSAPKNLPPRRERKPSQKGRTLIPTFLIDREPQTDTLPQRDESSNTRFELTLDEALQAIHMSDSVGITLHSPYTCPQFAEVVAAEERVELPRTMMTSVVEHNRDDGGYFGASALDYADACPSSPPLELANLDVEKDTPTRYTELGADLLQRLTPTFARIEELAPRKKEAACTFHNALILCATGQVLIRQTGRTIALALAFEAVHV